MPTPPPWWNDTQVAPPEVFDIKLSKGQSDTASEPSFIDSVSLLGDATEPQSKWSRPITIGPFTLPVLTKLLNSKPAFSLSPVPSQQIRAGSPWNDIFCCAFSSQFISGLFSGNSSIRARSVVKISSGSPDSATHLNGPFPSQNSGL